MATKVARLNGPHSAGIFADMTIDGPEIGTLVLIVDRAKNLPNKKTMGKQNPYCAARLGKEAQKTETDKRGGQTPRWDQELRFTVHDSPDYYNLKISVFSEDKRTDLIGEAWVDLGDVIVAGGGKNDLWQGLNCKGKYAGELRIELTYYDSRQKPEKVSDLTASDHDLRHGSGKVKRRPLPVNPNIPSTTPVVIAERPLPGRARHGPREIQITPRPTSMPPQELAYPFSQATLMMQKSVTELPSGSPAPPTEHNHPTQSFEEEQQVLRQDLYAPQHAGALTPPDFLPQLAPSSRRPASMVQQPYPEPSAAPMHQYPPPQGHHPAVSHSHSAPSVPMARPDHRHYDQSYGGMGEPFERNHGADQQFRHEPPQSHSVPPAWDRPYGEPYSDKQVYEDDREDAAPPPPPVHSNSAPTVPHYSPAHDQHPYTSSRYEATPPHVGQQYISNSSPLQNVERHHGLPTPSQPYEYRTRGHSVDHESPSVHYNYASTTPDLSPVQTSSPYGRTPPSQHFPHRQSVAEPYVTPSRPHPLSQEMPRNSFPDPTPLDELPGSAPPSYGRAPRERRSWVQDAPPLIKPRAISPNPSPGPSNSSPISHQASSHSMAHHSAPSQPPQEQYKPYKPRNTYSIQFPVRAFESSDESPLAAVRQQAPNAVPTRKSVSPRPSMANTSASSTPFSPDSFDVHNPHFQPQAGAEGVSNERSDRILDWDGNEIHPSDHLPVDSWAPEPEQKAPNKTYGLGRDRDFGPRNLQGVPTKGGRISKDTIINFRRKTQPDLSSSAPATAPIQNGRLEKSRPSHSPIESSRDHDEYARAPNSYAQPDHGYSTMDHRYPTRNYMPPSVPPKIPLQQDQGYDRNALSREIASIDIGSSRSRPPPSAVAYVPVRSHRDRNSFY